MNDAKRNHPFAYYLRRFQDDSLLAMLAAPRMFNAAPITDEDAERLMRDDARDPEREQLAPDGAP